MGGPTDVAWFCHQNRRQDGAAHIRLLRLRRSAYAWLGVRSPTADTDRRLVTVVRPDLGMQPQLTADDERSPTDDPRPIPLAPAPHSTGVLGRAHTPLAALAATRCGPVLRAPDDAALAGAIARRVFDVRLSPWDLTTTVLIEGCPRCSRRSAALTRGSGPFHGNCGADSLPTVSRMFRRGAAP